MRTRLMLAALTGLALLAAGCTTSAPTQPQETTPASQTPSAAAQPPAPAPERAGAESPQPATEQPRRSQAAEPRTSAGSARQPEPARAASSAPKPTATAYAPPEPPKPEMVELPAGTVLELELVDALSTRISMAGDTFKARVIDPVSMGGKVVIPLDSIVEGTVTEAVSAKKMTGQASLKLQFTQVKLPSGHSVEISAMLSEKGKKIGKRTAGIVGGSAAGGAVLGRIIGKDTKGAVVGALIGAAAGSGVAASQKGQELKLPAGTGLSIEIETAVQVPVPPERG